MHAEFKTGSKLIFGEGFTLLRILWTKQVVIMLADGHMNGNYVLFFPLILAANTAARNN